MVDSFATRGPAGRPSSPGSHPDSIPGLSVSLSSWHSADWSCQTRILVTSIHTGNEWGREVSAKCKVQNAKCEMRNAKWLGFGVGGWSLTFWFFGGVGFGGDDRFAHDVHQLGAFVGQRQEAGGWEQFGFDAGFQPNSRLTQLFQADAQFMAKIGATLRRTCHHFALCTRFVVRNRCRANRVV